MIEQGDEQLVYGGHRLVVKLVLVNETIGAHSGVLYQTQTVIDFFLNDGASDFMRDIGSDSDSGGIDFVVAVPGSYATQAVLQVFGHKVVESFQIAKMNIQIPTNPIDCGINAGEAGNSVEFGGELLQYGQIGGVGVAANLVINRTGPFAHIFGVIFVAKFGVKGDLLKLRTDVQERKSDIYFPVQHPRLS